VHADGDTRRALGAYHLRAGSYQRLAQVLHEIGLLILGVDIGEFEVLGQWLAALQVKAAAGEHQRSHQQACERTLHSTLLIRRD
jgi:hypothetical protein